MRQSLQNTFPLLLALTIFAVLGASCRSRIVTPKSYTTDSYSLTGSTEWEITSHGEFETLRKEWITPHGRLAVHTLGLESCDTPIGKERRSALVRQMFSGFSAVHVGEIREVARKDLELSFAKIHASLDNVQIGTVLLSVIHNGCLFEQAFWSNTDPSWIDDPKIEELILAEVASLPPWALLLQAKEIK